MGEVANQRKASSAAGSEDASIHVIETATARRVSGPIDRAQYPNISWRPDSKAFFYLRQQEMKAGMPVTDKYKNGRNWLHVVGTDPAKDVAVAGPGLFAQVARMLDLRLSPETLAHVPHAAYGALIIAFLLIEPLGLGKIYANVRNYFLVWPFGYEKK